MEASRRDDKRGETGNGARLAHPRLKGCTRTEFQACAQYLLGISSRHISVVTRRIPVPEQSPHRPYPSPDRLTRDDILFAKSPACRLPLLLILCAQEFLASTLRCATLRFHSAQLSSSLFLHISTFHLPYYSLSLFSLFSFQPLFAQFSIQKCG